MSKWKFVASTWINGEDGETLATLNTGLRPAESSRIGHLIAAAPALADALRDLLAYLESPALHDAAVAIPRARAALALADGSKP
jgi:hypothetical protein